MLNDTGSSYRIPKFNRLDAGKEELVKNTQLIFNTVVPRISKDYPIKLLYVPDMHMLIKEPKNRNNLLISRTHQLIDELCYIMVENGINGVIFGGDIADAGEASAALNDESQRINKIIKIVKCADGNGYAVYGNHEGTYHVNNMFYTIASIDSDELAQEIFGFNRPELIYPYIRTPAVLDYGVAKIYLMHFRRQAENKKYKVLDQNYKTICIYHDDLISFESEMELYHHRLGKGINVHNSDIFENVDWAIAAHIHTPLETFQLKNGRETVVDCPGSFIGRTVAEKHEKIKLPVICIDESGLHREYLNFNIGTFKETINEEMVASERGKRAMTALLKKETVDTFNVIDVEDLLANIQNASVRSIISRSQMPIVPNALGMYNQWYQNKYSSKNVEESPEDGDIDIFEDEDDFKII